MKKTEKNDLTFGCQKKEKNNAYVDNIGAVASGEWVIVLVLRSYFSIHIHISNLILLLPLCEIIKTTKCS